MNSPPATGIKTSQGESIRGIARKIFSFPVFLAMLLVVGAYVGRLGNLDQAPSSHSSIFWLEGDTWWHLAVAARILKTHVWPTHDIFSFTAFGSPWIDYEWLGDIVLNLFWRHGGLQGLMIFITLFAGLVMILLYYYASIRSGNCKAAFVASALLLLLASLQFTTRPQVLGYIFLIASFICLEKFRHGRAKALWLLPIVFWLWVNTHGTFVLGFLILGVYWVSGLWDFQYGRIYAKRWTVAQRRQLELAFLLCLIASILTPYGTRMAAYPLKMFSSQHQIIQAVQEWQPLDLSQFYGKFFLVLLMLFWLGLATSDLKYRVEDCLLLAFATAETFMHARFVLLFVPLFAPLAAEMLARWVPKYEPAKDHPGLNFALMALIAFGIVKSFPSSQRIGRQLEYEVPIRAVPFLKEHPQLTRMFNEADWGSYLDFTLGPSRKVFLDGRYDIYEYSGVLSDYLAIIHVAPDALFLLNKYRVDSCLIFRGSPLATLLATSPDWKQIYRDDLSVLFVRTPRGQITNSEGSVSLGYKPSASVNPHGFWGYLPAIYREARG
jgi:hypothetical protein